MMMKAYDKIVGKLGKPEEFFDTILKENQKQKAICFLIAFFTCLFAYSPILLKWLPNQDGLYYGFFFRPLSAYAVENSGGRFANTILAHFKSLFIFPAFDVVLSSIFLALAVTIIIFHYKVDDFWARFVLSVFLVITPCFCATMTYYYCTDTYFLAVLCAMLAVCTMNKKKNLFWMIISSGMIVVVLSVYQVYIFIAGSMCLIDLILMIMDKNQQTKKIICNAMWYIVCVVVGGLVYGGLFFYLQKAWCFSAFAAHGFDVSSGETIKDYFIQFIQPYIYFFECYFGNGIISNSIFSALINVTVILLVAIVIVNVLKYNEIDKSRKAMLLVCVGLVPFVFQGVAILSSKAIMYILMFPTIGLLYIMAFALINQTGCLPNWVKSNGIKIGYLIVLTVVCFGQLRQVWSYQKSRADSIASTYEIASDIVKEIESIENSKEHPIMIGWGESSISNMVYNGSYAGSIGWLSFMQQYMGLNYEMCSDEQINAILEMNEYKEMPSFPDEGYVQLIDDTIVAKFEK